MTQKWRRTVSEIFWPPHNGHLEVPENKFRLVGGYFRTQKWRRTVSAISRQSPNTPPEVQKNSFCFTGGYFLLLSTFRIYHLCKEYSARTSRWLEFEGEGSLQSQKPKTSTPTSNSAGSGCFSPLDSI